VRAVFSNADGNILPGQFVRVHLEGARYKDAVSVPQGAVLNTQQGAMVWTIDDKDQVAPRPVVLGDSVGNDYLIEKGLTPGERVVVEGVIKVRPGMVVRVRDNAPSTAASPTGTTPAQPKSAATDAPKESRS